jgi:hypothetical protein
MNASRHTALAFAAAMLCAAPAAARILPVGPTHTLKQPSQAAIVAAAGDIVRIDPGRYADCAVWTASRLVIEAAGPGVLLAGKTCAQMGIFVILGSDVTVRGLTFADASVVWHNGAGIRMAGNNLTVENSRFLNNENGILAGGGPDSVLRITGSQFIGNGACIEACAHGVYAGAPIRLLDINHCIFLDTRTAHHIKSRARNTIVTDSQIEDGADGTASYLIETPNGGNLLVQRNTLEKGPHSGNPAAAISIGVEGVTNRTEVLIIRDNTFRNDMAEPTTFVRNSTTTPAQLAGNTLTGNVLPLSGPAEVADDPKLR